MGPIVNPETSVTANLRCVTSQKGEGLIYTAAEAWNLATFPKLTVLSWLVKFWSLVCPESIRRMWCLSVDL